MKKITKMVMKILVMLSTMISLFFSEWILLPVRAEGLDVRNAIEQIISPIGDDCYHYSFDGGKNFDTLLTSDDASQLYNIGLDCTAGSLAIVSKALRNAGLDPYQYFAECKEYLNAQYPWDLATHFTNMTCITKEAVTDTSVLQEGDILVYGNTNEKGHMSVYAGNGETFDFGTNNFANYMPYLSEARVEGITYPLSAVYRINTQENQSSRSLSKAPAKSQALLTSASQTAVLKMYKKDADTGNLVSLTSSAFKIHMLKDTEGNDVSDKTDTDTEKQNRLVSGVVQQTVTEADGNHVYNVFMTASKQQSSSLDSLEEGVFYGIRQASDDTYAISTTPIELPQGEYELEEVITSEGFVTNERMKFTVGKDTIINENNQNIVEVYFENKQLTGSLYFTKEILGWDEADVSLAEEKLESFGFTLYAEEDIISPSDGSVIVEKGKPAMKLTHDTANPYQMIGEVHPDANGKFSFTDIPLGNYVLKETFAPGGYVVDPDGWKITISQSKFDKKVEEVRYDESKPRPKVLPGRKAYLDRSVWESDVSITIEGENTNTYTIQNDITKTTISKKSITSQDELEGAHLSIQDESGNTLAEWISSSEPYQIAALPQGKYKLVEAFAPDGYYYQNDVSFTVEDTMEIRQVQMEDRPIIYQIKKVDENGKTVEGVKLKLFDITDLLNKQEIQLPNDGITTENPFKLIQVLKAQHTYELVEEEYKEGFFQAASIQFTVPKYCDEELSTITMEDLRTNVSVIKVDQHNEPVPGARLSVLKGVQNEDGTVSPLLNENGEAISVYEFVTTKEAEDISQYVKGSNEVSEEVYYILRETETPDGYETSQDIVFQVTGDHQTKQLIRMIDIRKQYSISVLKVDASDQTKKLKGAQFQLFTKDGDIVKDVNGDVCEGITDASGKLTWTMDYGNCDKEYYVKEIKAPQGYLLNRKEFKISLEKDSDTSVALTIKNEKIPTVDTGDHSHLIYFASMLMMAFICGYFAIKCRILRD